MKRLLLVAVILTVLVVVIVVGIKALRHQPDEATLSKTKPAVVVVVDPAHGGRDPGANSDGVFEKDVTLAVANKISALAGEYPGLRVVLTRSTDAEVVSDERIAIANREGAALYVAIHVNAFNKPTATGIETWVDTTHTSGDPSWTFARSVEKAVVASTSAKDRGVRTQDLFLKRLTIPAAATEVGFITSPDERTKLLDPTYQDLVARGILQGVCDYVAAAGIVPQTVTGTTPAQGGARTGSTTPATGTPSSHGTQGSAATAGTTSTQLAGTPQGSASTTSGTATSRSTPSASAAPAQKQPATPSKPNGPTI